MPMPGWWRHLNKQIFNPLTLSKNHKWALITHQGRRSGTMYTTPVEAFPVPGGFAVFLMYGRNTDWAKNVLSSGSAVMLAKGMPYELCNPRIVDLTEIDSQLPADANRPPSILRVRELIRLDIYEPEAVAVDEVSMVSGS